MPWIKLATDGAVEYWRELKIYECLGRWQRVCNWLFFTSTAFWVSYLLVRLCSTFSDGVFGAMMTVDIQNDGPVTIIVENAQKSKPSSQQAEVVSSATDAVIGTKILGTFDSLLCCSFWESLLSLSYILCCYLNWLCMTWTIVKCFVFDENNWKTAVRRYNCVLDVFIIITLMPRWKLPVFMKKIAII